jgi:hypothetical protein
MVDLVFHNGSKSKHFLLDIKIRKKLFKDIQIIFVTYQTIIFNYQTI